MQAPGPSLWPSLFPLVAVPIPPVGPGGRGRSPLDPAHQPEADAGRVRQHARTLQSRGLTRPLTPASTLPPSAAEPSLASIFRPFFQTLILTLNLSSRGAPLEALGAALAPKGAPEAPKCLQKVIQIWLQTGFGEMLFLMTPPMKIAHFGSPGSSEMKPKRYPRNNAVQRCSKMLPEALQRGPRWSRGRLSYQNGPPQMG